MGLNATGNEVVVADMQEHRIFIIDMEKDELMCEIKPRGSAHASKVGFNQPETAVILDRKRIAVLDESGFCIVTRKGEIRARLLKSEIQKIPQTEIKREKAFVGIFRLRETLLIKI